MLPKVLCLKIELPNIDNLAAPETWAVSSHLHSFSVCYVLPPETCLRDENVLSYTEITQALICLVLSLMLSFSDKEEQSKSLS